MVYENKKLSSSSKSLKPREDSPLLGSPTSKHLSSPSKTLANVFIAIVGAGVLGLPYAFKRTGWLMSIIMLFSVAGLTHYCMMLLVLSRRKLHSISPATLITSFGDLGFAVCGSPGRFVVDILIILSQTGFCVGYLIFIANTLADLFNSSKAIYIWGCFPFQLGLSAIATLTHLAPLSIFADVVDLGAMGVVIVEDIMLMLRNRPEVIAFAGFSVFFYGIGVAVYAFEGIGMVLPLESEMRDKDKFGRILALGMLFISVLYGSFGLLGYLAFGDETKDIITSNLGAGLISSLVQYGLCINLFFTFPVMMNPVYEILERRFWGGRYCMWLRWLLVFAVTLVALMVPNFADFLSLVGSSVCCALGFVLPALFHLLVFKEEMGWKGWSLDVGIVALGVVLAVSGTWSALVEIFSVKYRLFCFSSLLLDFSKSSPSPPSRFSNLHPFSSSPIPFISNPSAKLQFGCPGDPKVNTIFQLLLVAAALLQPEFGTDETQLYITYLSWLVAGTTVTSTGAYGAQYMKNRSALLSY